MTRYHREHPQARALALSFNSQWKAQLSPLHSMRNPPNIQWTYQYCKGLRRLESPRWSPFWLLLRSGYFIRSNLSLFKKEKHMFSTFLYYVCWYAIGELALPIQAAYQKTGTRSSARAPMVPSLLSVVGVESVMPSNLHERITARLVNGMSICLER